MSSKPKITFAKAAVPGKGTAVVLTDESLAFAAGAEALVAATGGAVARAIAAEKFKGKAYAVLDIVAPAGTELDRLLVVGLGKPGDGVDYVRLGGVVFGRIGKAADVAILAERPGGTVGAAEAADIGLGLRLRAYDFDRYKTRKKDDEPPPAAAIVIGTAEDAAARRAFKDRDALADGVDFARDLVNEPPNVLFPEEFAKRASALGKLGVEVEVLDEKALKKLGMRALLGVGQGSAHESRVVIMRWNGGKASEKPFAVVGKGVCFDTGGISIKQAAGMEDMKGDMGGAACVVGLMHALASRKAKVNVVGAIGLVENMPDGNAQRPGDIVTSMSGQTIEIINTDAEGRLVLADVLWHIHTAYKPAGIVDLATLTGAIMVALGQEHAGLFSNDDALAEGLLKAGLASGEKLWRMPLGPEYDKLIDSKFADMKNTGGRFGGSITAAQFLKRFVEDIPWAHLDIAGTAMGSNQTDTNRSWGSGFGVRLLDRYLRDRFES